MAFEVKLLIVITLALYAGAALLYFLDGEWRR
jgi:hypothetical protein